MKKLAFSFLALLFVTSTFAQDELVLTHQTIIAKSREMKIYDPVFVDLDEDQQLLVKQVTTMLITGKEPYKIAQKQADASKVTGLEQLHILRWAIREAAIATLGLENHPQARTWSFPQLMKTQSARNLSVAYRVKSYFDAAKRVISSIE